MTFIYFLLFSFFSFGALLFTVVPLILFFKKKKEFSKRTEKYGFYALIGCSLFIGQHFAYEVSPPSKHSSNSYYDDSYDGARATRGGR